MSIINRLANPLRSNTATCSADEMNWYATRVDVSKYITDEKLLARAGKIYEIYLWTPDLAVHIASFQRSAEIFPAGFIPEKWNWEDDSSAEEWSDIEMELMRCAESVSYTDHDYMKRKLNTKNSKSIGCFETSDDAEEYYRGNPVW